MLKELKKWLSEDSGADTTAHFKPLGAAQYSGIPRVAEDERRFRSRAARGQNTSIARKRRPCGESTLQLEIAFDMPQWRHAAERVQRAIFLEALGGATSSVA
jgi:hypothetical protein